MSDFVELVSKSIIYVRVASAVGKIRPGQGKSVLFRVIGEGLPEKVKIEQRPGGSEGEAVDDLREEHARQKEQQVQHC